MNKGSLVGEAIFMNHEGSYQGQQESVAERERLYIRGDAVSDD